MLSRTINKIRCDTNIYHFSGLGFAICQRLISEFLETKSTSEDKLLLIPTTRSKSKADDTLRRLVLHLSQVCAALERHTRNRGIAAFLEEKIEIEPLLVDLNSIVSVHGAAKELNRRLKERGLGLDVLLCNAGIGGWDGVDWWVLIKQIFTKGPYSMMSRPGYKIARPGRVTPRQLPSTSSSTKSGEGNGSVGMIQEEEPPVGEVFCANLFGHYLLGHWVTPSLLRVGEKGDRRGRVIWVSTLEAYPSAFDINDLQGLTTAIPYESSKRLTDILALSSELPSTQPYVSSYFGIGSSTPVDKITVANGPVDSDETDTDASRPKIYLSHPGICATPIMPIHPIMVCLQVLAFYLARLCGSYWHCISAWCGATAPTWLALAPQKLLDQLEGTDGKGKWGSTVDVWGRERAVRTEVQSWGWGGKVGEVRLKTGRWDLWVNSEETLKSFEELGERAWREMEALRMEWEGRIEKAGLEDGE